MMMTFWLFMRLNPCSARSHSPRGCLHLTSPRRNRGTLTLCTQKEVFFRRLRLLYAPHTQRFGPNKRTPSRDDDLCFGVGVRRSNAPHIDNRWGWCYFFSRALYPFGTRRANYRKWWSKRRAIKTSFNFIEQFFQLVAADVALIPTTDRHQSIN